MDRLRMARRLELLFLGDISAPRLCLIAGLPIIAAAWLLVGSGWVLSRHMTWDLLFNLAGAWHLYNGHIPHVDFHDPVGRFVFDVTWLGFLIDGPGPRAFLIGELFLLAGVFAAGVFAAARRLPVLPAVLFVLCTSLLVLIPINIGDPPNAFSFAMAYNRWGWTGLAILFLVLFIPVRRGHPSPWPDAILSAVLVLFMFYVKISFALAGAAAVAYALVGTSHVRTKWHVWALAMFPVLVNAVAPFNHAYLADIWHATTKGYLRDSLGHFMWLLDEIHIELAFYGSGVLVLFSLWLSRLAKLETALAGALILGLGVLTLSQNAQSRHIPVAIVVSLLIYDALRNRRHELRVLQHKGVLGVGSTLLLGPFLMMAAEMMSLAGYYRAATRDTGTVRIHDTNLRGLSAPADNEAAHAPDITETLLSSTGDVPQHPWLGQAQYLRTLMEAASLFENDRHPTGILVLDQVNPLPFLLGYQPPRGGDLWTWWQVPHRPAADVFRDVEVVLIPKYSTDTRSTVYAWRAYREYMQQHFPSWEQTPSWFVMRRSAAAGS